ncbi:MAG: hypothetical protein NZ534_07020, partial [Bacteroidia bacterium]|nr:hypothetical protein [Bacteroidia bacterium]
NDRTPSDALFQYQTANGSATVKDPSGYGFELFSAVSSDGSAQYTIDVLGLEGGAYLFVKLSVGANGAVNPDGVSVKVKCNPDRIPLLEAALK